MAEILKQAPWYIYAVLIASIVLGVAGFLVPPTGVIDGSVLKYIAEIMGGTALLDFVVNLPKYIEAGAKAKFEHGNTSITVGKNEPEN